MVRQILHPQGVAAIQSGFFLTFPHRTIFTTVKAAGFSSVLAYRPHEAFNAVTLAGMRSDLASALEAIEVPVQTASLVRTRHDLDRLIVYGRIRPYQWIGVQASSLFLPTILRNPDRVSLWQNYLKPRLNRWFRSARRSPLRTASTFRC